MNILRNRILSVFLYVTAFASGQQSMAQDSTLVTKVKIQISEMDNVGVVAEAIAEDTLRHPLSVAELDSAKADLLSIIGRLETSDAMSAYKLGMIQDLGTSLKSLNQGNLLAGLTTLTDFAAGSGQTDLANNFGALLNRTGPNSFLAINALYGGFIDPAHIDVNANIRVRTELGRSLFTDGEFEEGDSFTFSSKIMGTKTSQLSYSGGLWTPEDRLLAALIQGGKGALAGAGAGAAAGGTAGTVVPILGNGVGAFGGGLIGGAIGFGVGFLQGHTHPETAGFNPSGSTVETKTSSILHGDGTKTVTTTKTTTNHQTGNSHTEEVIVEPGAADNSKKPPKVGEGCVGDCGGGSMPNEKNDDANKNLDPIAAANRQAKLDFVIDSYQNPWILTGESENGRKKFLDGVKGLGDRLVKKSTSLGLWEGGESGVVKMKPSKAAETFIKAEIDSVVFPPPIQK